MSQIARSKRQYAFVKLESQSGVLALPSSTDSVALAESLTSSQTPTYTDSTEIQNTRGILERYPDGLPAGDFDIKVIARPTGVATVPMGDPLFESLMGQKTINAGDVAYGQALEKPSFTICYRKGHMVYYCLGATSHEMGVQVTKKGAVELSFKGKFMQRICMGDDNVATLSSAAQNQVFVADAGRFMVGGYVYNPACAANAGAADSNIGAQGYLITAIDRTNHILTLQDNLVFAWAVSEEVLGWLPATEKIGTSIMSKDSQIKINGALGKIKDMDLSINDPCQYLEDEITGSAFPTEYVEGDRQISGSFKSYFRKEDSTKVAQGYSNEELDLSLEFGSTVGTKMRIHLPRVPAEVPTEEEDGPSLVLSQSFTALETLGEDSAVIYFE